LAAVALVGLPACGGEDSEPAEPERTEALSFTDDFVRRLVGGEGIEGDSTVEIEQELTRLQEQLARDGVRNVGGPGRVRGDCPENPALAAGSDCIVYTLYGTQTRPVAGAQPINALLRLWVQPDDDGWVVSNYTYDARLPEEPR
jgi:hypothetical protein